MRAAERRERSFERLDLANAPREAFVSPTIYIARLLGLYLVAISAAMLMNRRATLATISEMAKSGPWMLFAGMMATAAGLALVLAHNVWSGGALKVAVTLAGWAALLKGLVLLAVPARQVEASCKALGLERYFYIWFGAVFIVGAWLTLTAFAI